MRKIITGLGLFVLLASISFGAWTYSYDIPTLTVTAGAYSLIDVSTLGETSTIWIANDSTVEAIYISWDGRLTNEAQIIAHGFQLKPLETQGRDIHTQIGPKLVTTTGEASSRVSIIF